MDAKQLVQEFEGDRGGRVNRFVRKDEALNLSVRVHSEKLPKDVDYTLTFGPADAK